MLHDAFKHDLNWFNTFLVQFNGVTFYDNQKPDAIVFSDALLKCLEGTLEKNGVCFAIAWWVLRLINSPFGNIELSGST